MRQLFISIVFLIAASAQYSPPSGGSGGGATIPKTTHLICGDNNGNGALCTPDLTPAAPITFAQGAIASLPSCTTTLNEIYYPTDSYYTQINCLTGASSWTYFASGKQMFPPAAASNWTVVNGSSGTATVNDTKGAVILSTASDVLGLEGAFRATPATPYTKTIALQATYSLGGSPTNADIAGCGVAWTNGTTTSSSWQEARIASYWLPSSTVQQKSTIFQVHHGTNFAWSGDSNDTLLYAPSFNPSAVVYFQLIDDATNRTIKRSVDGINFTIVYGPTSRTSPFTPTNYGIVCGAQDAGGGVPFSLTLLSDN